MGNFAQDQDERLRNLRKFYDDGQFVDWLETLAEMVPDAATAYLGGALIAGGGTAVGALVGGVVGGITLGPWGLAVGTAIGAGAGAYFGITLGHKFDHWYRSATTEERARLRAMGLKIGRGGRAVYRFGT